VIGKQGAAGRTIAVFLVVATVPIEIGRFRGAPLAPADVVTPLLAAALLYRGIPRRTWFGWWMLATALGLVVVLLGLQFTPRTPVTAPLLSLVYYAKPWVVFLAAIVIARDLKPELSDRVLTGIAAVLSATTLWIYVEGVRAGSLVVTSIRATSTVTGFTAGARVGDPVLFGAGQVNTTAALLFALTPVVLTLLDRRRDARRYLWLLPMCTSWVIIVRSGSRSALAALAVYLLVAVFIWLRRTGPTVARRDLLRIAVAVTLLPLAVWGIATVVPSASPKYVLSAQALAAGDISTLSSGRTDMTGVMLADVARSPVVGTAFQDFSRFHAGGPLEASSPHNQYVGALHKGGILAGVPFLVLIAAAFPYRRNRARRFLGLPLGVAAYGVLLIVLDPFTSPVLAAVLLSLFGMQRGASLRGGT
jgi:hypothetical protein